MTGPVHVGVLVLQAAILGALAVGLWRRNASVAVNALVAFGATLLPPAADTLLPGLARSVTPGHGIEFWIATAGLLHTVGMLGLYESTWWWDHLTHTLSAALVAAAVYAGLLAVGSGSPGEIPAIAVVGFTLAFTMAVGVFWELLELLARDLGERFDVPPVLEHYGLRDTVLDLVFDGVGALLVVAFDVRIFVPVAERFPRLAEWLLYGGSVAVFVGTLGLGVLLEQLGNGADREG